MTYRKGMQDKVMSLATAQAMLTQIEASILAIVTTGMSSVETNIGDKFSHLPIDKLYELKQKYEQEVESYSRPRCRIGRFNPTS